MHTVSRFLAHARVAVMRIRAGFDLCWTFCNSFYSSALVDKLSVDALVEHVCEKEKLPDLQLVVPLIVVISIFA